MPKASASTLAQLPSVDRLLQMPAATALSQQYGRTLLTDAIRQVVGVVRLEVAAGTGAQLDEFAILERARQWLEAVHAPSLRPVYNLTGTVLHTNLGRAPLPPEAVAAIACIAGEASTLEFSLQTGERGERDEHVEFWLEHLTGAEAATVVNNNAAALLLTLNSLANRKEVIVSRGELIEIGGSFRLPDIMARAGCRIREVGTTNCTKPADYRDAIGARTAALLKVHTSNYRLEGFTAAVSERELAAAARAAGLPLVVDLGSGSLADLSALSLPPEPTPRQMIAAGADIVTFSGDKLLGGPQAGIIVGKRSLVDRVRRNPLKRALRVDKLTIAALAAVLRLHANPETLAARLPALRLLTRPAAEIEVLATRLRPVLARALQTVADVDVIACHSQIGSGARPVDLLPSFGLRLTPRRKPGRRGAAMLSPRGLAAAFRNLPTPVIGRISKGAFVLDLRCLEQVDAFVQQLDALVLPAGGGT